MKTRILGAIGVVFGGFILLSGLLNGMEGQGNYALGQIAGLIFGGALFMIGLYSLLKKKGHDTYLR